MADLYFFPVNPAEWLAGEATSAMTPAQEGAFFRLLCRQWMAKDTPCSLPNDDVRLAHLSRLGDEWLTVGAFVRAQFEEVKGDPTRIRNPKLWRVWREAQQQHRSRVSAGKHGGQTKAANRRRMQVRASQQDSPSSNARALLGQDSSNAVAEHVAMPSSYNNNKSNNKKLESENKQTGYPPDFEMLWKAYPKREGANSKSAALKAYGARLKEGVDFTVMQDGTHRYDAFLRAKGWLGTEYVMQASRFYGPEKPFLETWEVAPPATDPPKSDVVAIGGIPTEAELRRAGIRLA